MEISSQRHESIQEDKQSKDKTDTFGFSQREARRIDILTPAVFERITRFWSLCKYLSKSLFASAACADERSSFARSRTLVPELMWTGVCVCLCVSEHVSCQQQCRDCFQSGSLLGTHTVTLRSVWELFPPLVDVGRTVALWRGPASSWPSTYSILDHLSQCL